MNRRDLLGGLGAGLGLLGIAGIVAPSLFAGLSVSRSAILLVGIGVLVLSVRAIGDRRSHPPTGADTDDPETAPDLATPGDEFDREVGDVTDRPRHGRARERIRERLREAAIATLRRQRDCSRAEAVGLLDRGEWTDDAVAAAAFSGQGFDESIVDSVRRYVRGESRFEYRARRAALAIERLGGSDE